MASSSSMASPASSLYPHYDIFLNHRGPDVKATFAKDLYRRLTCSGLQVFLDDPEMKPGCDISAQIEAAIGVASVNVAIFSPRYADSKWCLEELVLMVASMDSRAAVILPVFYNVKPYELQTYAGRYSDALRSHEEKKHYDLETIKKWRDALRRVAKISGFDLDACNGNEEELLEKVVQAVLERVPKPPLFVAKFPTGLGEKLQELQTTVLSHEEGRPEAKVVGIVGGGGIGKTTLAKEYFNRQRSEYGRSSFLFDVRENAARKSLHSLQSDLLKDLKSVTIQIQRWEEGIGQLTKNLKACDKVLVILDDVDHLDQLNAFLPIKDVLHPKSLILVTSRDKGLLIRARIAESSIYHLSCLDRIHSQQLFCSHAFSQSYPPPEYQYLVDGFLNACDGLPLSLKVFGALLYGQYDQSYWKGVLEGLNKTLHADIQETLRISYDSLSEEEQQIFLDIACFAIGQDRDKWIKIWNGSGWQGLVGFRNLQYKCLVDVNMPSLEQCLPEKVGSRRASSDLRDVIFCKDKKIRMHDHLRDLGRHIADTEVRFPRLMAHRVWNSGETLRDLLEESPSVNPVVRGICSKGLLSLNEAGHEVSRIRKLQLLDAERSDVQRILASVRSANLMWLRWKDCLFESLPEWIPLRDLRVLEVSGGLLERLWKEKQAPLQLEELIIDSPLSGLPKSIGQLKHLQKIVLLEFGWYETTLGTEAIPEEFYDLCSLKYLKVSSTSLSGFGDLGKLTNLQHIDLAGCSDLRSLPDSLGNLSNLQLIDLAGCSDLRSLPDSLGNLSNLQYFSLFSCTNLESIPNSIGNLSNLQYLNLRQCVRLFYVPNYLGNLSNLQYLDLSCCEKLSYVIDSHQNLSNLQYLCLSECTKLEMLPGSLWNLRNLRVLHINDCKMLQTLGDSSKVLSTNIREIDLSFCSSLMKLPNCLGSLTNLRHLNIYGCESLKMLPGSFGNLTNLRSIYLSWCKSLKRIPDSLRNVNLQCIHLDNCTSLEMLPESLGNLTSLQDIRMDGCKNLKMLPTSFWNLSQLKHVHLSSSLTISSEALGNIISLKCFQTKTYCVRMDSSLPQFVRQPCLERITLLDTDLKELPSDIAGRPTNLEFLKLRSPSREVLPPFFGYLKSLKELVLSYCQKLQCLPESIGLLTQLTDLEIWDCGIQYLPPGVMKLNNLERLYISKCPLQELPFRKEEGVEGDTTLLAESSRGKRVQLSELDSSAEKGMMVKLKELRLRKTEISEISFPEGVCPNLQFLNISFCSKLVEVVGALPVTLEQMWLTDCHALSKMGRLDGLVQLSGLIIRGCPLPKIKIRGCPTQVDLMREERHELPSLSHCEWSFWILNSEDSE